MSVDPISFIATWSSIEKGALNNAGFEGPEKRLEVIGKMTSKSPKEGLLAAPQSAWEKVISVLNAKIVSKMGDDTINAYVLTESSLFVTPTKMILITCGTTTLLDAIPAILDILNDFSMDVEWASFMRKNYSYPWEQKGPHANVESEYQTLKKYFPRGKPFIFGPVDADHYFFFAHDNIQRPCIEADSQMSVTMYDIDPDVSKIFFSSTFESTNAETKKIREATKMDDLLFKGWEVQDLQFEPCGYSVNAILRDEYQTIHVTPEQHCSFASYETSSPLRSVKERFGRVLSIFKPKRFAVVILVDPHSEIGQGFAKEEDIGVEPQNFPDYGLLNRTANEFSHGYILMELNYVSKALVEEKKV